MNLFVSPVVGSKMVEWTINSLVWRSKTHWGNRAQHIVRFLNAISPDPFHFSLDIEVSQALTFKKGNKHKRSTSKTSSNTTSPTVLDIAVTSPCVVDEAAETEDFQRLLDQFPDWAQVTPCISSYSSWQF